MSCPRRMCLVPLLGCALAAAFFGCGKQGPERTVISGTVSYQGKPVKEGVIRLAPAPGTEAPVTSAVIRDGRYSLDAHGGVPVGTHKIEITAFGPVARRPAPADDVDFPGIGSGPKVAQYIPEKYNVKSELEITIPPGSGKITKNFDLTD